MDPQPTRTRDVKLKSMPVHRLERGRFQPRHAIDGPALKKLAESIRAQGVLQPIFVRKAQRGKFEIVAGERRWHAAKMAGLKSIPTLVGEVSDDSALALALIESLHREDLNPIDQAVAMQRLVDDFAMTHGQIADMLGRSRAAVTNLLRLLELPADVRTMVCERELDMGHARALLALPREERQRVAHYVVSHDLTVRDVERIAKQPSSLQIRNDDSDAEAATPGFGITGWIRKRFGKTISVRTGKRGRCHVSFSFSSPEELRKTLEAISEVARQLEEISIDGSAASAPADRENVVTAVRT